MEIDKQRIAQLVKAVQNGDNNAFEELYKLTSQRAYFIALEFTKNNHDAEDILQDSYMKALSKINELDKPESFLSWFNQIVANKSKDFLKKKKPSLFETDETDAFEIMPDEDVSVSPEDSLDQNELQKIVMEVLDELSEEKRGCVLMMYFEELSVKEIANTLEISEGTVKTRLFSARKDLKDKFSRHGITSLYSITPFGVVAWALRKAAESTSKSFVASGASAKVLASVTVAGFGAEAAGAAASVAGAEAAGAGAAGAAGAGAAGASAASGAVTAGTSIGAKIAALSVAQKVIAGVSAAAVVAGGAAGIATVAENSNKNDAVSTTAYTEEHTTALSYETTFAVEAMGRVEFSETTEYFTNESKNPESSASKNLSTDRQSTTVKASVKSTSESSKRTTATKTNKVTTTKRSITTRVTATTITEKTASVKTTTTTTKATATKKLTTTKKASTTKTATTKKTSTTKPVTTKKASTTKPVTTQKASTTKAVTTTVKPTTAKPTTTEATTKGKATIVIKVIDLDNTVVDTLTYTVEEGTEMTSSYLWDLVEADGYSILGVFGSDKDTIAQAGKTYIFEAEL